MRFVLSCFLLALLLTSFANATDTRVISLGGPVPYIYDEINVFGNPGLMSNFSKRVVLELGSHTSGIMSLPTTSGVTSTQNGYAFLPLMGDKFYIGVAGLRHMDDFDNIELPSDLEAPDNSVDLLFSGLLGDLGIGLGIHRASNFEKNEQTSPQLTTTKKTSATGITVGAAMNTDEEPIFDAALNVTMNSFKDETKSSTTTSRESEGGTSISLYARSFLSLGESKLVPALEFWTFSYKDISKNDGTTTTNSENSQMEFRVGTGLMLNVLGGFIMPGARIVYAKSKTETSDQTEEQTALVLPELYLGIEVPVKDYLSIRCGYRRAFGRFNTKVTPESGGEIKTSQDWASAGMEPELISLGVGLRLFDGKVTIDASIEENTFIDGTYILSGIEGPLFGKVSIGINY